MTNDLISQIRTSAMFVDSILSASNKRGYTVEMSWNGWQIDFGNKDLHEQYLKNLYPAIIDPKANVAVLIAKIARGRPCTHRPMREVIVDLKATIVNR